MTNCKECATNNTTLQGQFPGPTFTTQTTELTQTIHTLISDNESARNPAAATTRQILLILSHNLKIRTEYRSLTALLKNLTHSSQLQIKPTPAEKKKKA